MPQDLPDSQADKLKTGHAGQAEDTGGAISKGSSNVCAFPARSATETQVARATAERLKVPFVDPLRARIEPAAVALLDGDVAIRRQALPIRRVDDVLLVAMASPGQPIAVRSLELLTGCKIRPAISPKSSLSVALRRVYVEGAKGDAGRQGHSVDAAKKSQGNKEAEAGALTVSVISNKGGVGKTHFSINLACALAKTGARVLVVDADLGSADVSNKLAVFPEHHLLDFLHKDRDMEDLVVSTKFHFDLIGGTYGDFKLANLYHAQKVKFIRHFKRISRGYDFAVFDLGAGIARTVLDFALGADRTVIVTTPQDLMSGYACAKAAFFRFKEIEEKLEARLAKYSAALTFSPMLVINQVNDLKQGVKIYKNIQRIADKNINVTEARFRIKPEYLGGMPYDRESFRMAEKRRSPFLVDFPHVNVSQCISHMSTKFSKPENTYDSRIRFRHPFRRFVAVLSQKI